MYTKENVLLYHAVCICEKDNLVQIPVINTNINDQTVKDHKIIYQIKSPVYRYHDTKMLFFIIFKQVIS